jgi:hypothetical protein
MNTGKVRRRLVEERTREFRDACEWLVDHPLLLWIPKIDRAAKLLVKAVAKAKQRSQAWPERRGRNGG